MFNDSRETPASMDVKRGLEANVERDVHEASARGTDICGACVWGMPTMAMACCLYRHNVFTYESHKYIRTHRLSWPERRV